MYQAPAALRDRPGRQHRSLACAERMSGQSVASHRRSLTRPEEDALGQKPPDKLIRKILVATDFSPTSARAVECAIGLATECDATLTVLHVIDIGWQPASGAATELMKELWHEGAVKMAQLGWSMCGQVEAQTRIEEGLPWEQILMKSGDFDLIVLGKSRPKPGWKLFSQQTTKRVVENALCPVMVV
jgi:nucleotide-binding universal stress UspA family protein